MSLNIAVDGPAGAGKSTIAKHISKKFNIAYLDTGAMYRATAYYAIERGVSVEDVNGVEAILDELKMDIVYKGDSQAVMVNGKDVTGYLREHDISMAASTISKIPSVRLKMVELQRQIAAKTDCVLDGRDIGSYVLPNAEYKFYITATAEERAKRRRLEFLEKGVDIEYEKILADVKARDHQDMTREFAPLKVADNAVVIDTTLMSIDEVLSKISEYLCK